MALCAFGISRLPLFFQEQIKGSKNAPIARFDGLCCYQTRSSLSRLARRAAFQKPRRKAKAKAKASVTPESASWGVLSIRRAIRQSLPDGGRPGGCEPSGRHAWRWPGTACAWQRSSRSDGGPGHAGPAAIKHGIDKQAVAPRPCPWLTGTPGQPILDALPLTVAQCVSFGYGPSAGFSPPQASGLALMIDGTPWKLKAERRTKEPAESATFLIAAKPGKPCDGAVFGTLNLLLIREQQTARRHAFRPSRNPNPA